MSSETLGTAVRAPGVRFEPDRRGRPGLAALRTDVAGFAGYAERGPLGAPVRVTDRRAFEAVFGVALPHGYLAPAVRGFLENGGQVCHVVRVADAVEARPARVVVPDASGRPALRVHAEHGTVVDPLTGAPRDADGRRRRFPSPGSWGDRLAVVVDRSSLGTTSTEGPQPPGGSASRVRSLAGFEPGSVVDVGDERLRRVVGIDPQRRELAWDRPVPVGSEIRRLETVEFALLVLLDGQVVERHRYLSLLPQHDRYVVRVLESGSRLAAEVLVPTTGDDWTDPARWPRAPLPLPLTGGRDGLSTVTKQHFLDALDELATVDEVSLLAIPDLVLRAEPVLPPVRATTPVDPCTVLDPPPRGRVLGRVRHAETEEPLAGVTVQLLDGSGREETTDGAGRFRFDAVATAPVELLLVRQGFQERTALATPTLSVAAEPISFGLSPVALPRPLSHDDVRDVNEAMMRQGAGGLYRVAILDPPGDQLGLEEIQTWRARFDPSSRPGSFAALYYPWLQVRAGDGTLQSVPPSGHVAGLIARTDLRRGVHHPPANHPLSGVQALTVPVDDALQAELNPLGVNCLRALPGRGIRVFGARTLSDDAVLRYLNARRLLLMIEEAVEDSTQWTVFEPLTAELRQTLVFTVGGFLEGLWRQGALAGRTPAEAFRVRCDPEINPAGATEVGQLIAEVEVAPVGPLEFITFRLGRTVDAVDVRE